MKLMVLYFLFFKKAPPSFGIYPVSRGTMLTYMKQRKIHKNSELALGRFLRPFALQKTVYKMNFKSIRYSKLNYVFKRLFYSI